jgi:FlaA1/EpsC-like NDP-sugar epimerase
MSRLQHIKLVFASRAALVRLALLLSLYTLLMVVCFYLAYEVRFDFSIEPEFQTDRIRQIWIVLLVKLGMLALFRQWGSMLTYFSIPDVLRLATAMLLSGAVMLIPRFAGHGEFTPPRGVLLVDMLLSFSALCALRLAFRVYRERVVMGKKLPGAPVETIAIVGAGDAGASLANDLLNTPARGFRPVVFLDDDVKKHGQFIHGVPVFGPPERLPFFKNSTTTTRVVIAMPSAPRKRVREIAFFLAQRGYHVETLPALEELASGRARVSRIRPVELADLLGREQVNLDGEAIRNFISHRVVVVTGAGGSIGSELCRQIVRYNPQRLLLIDQSEPSLFAIEQEMVEAGVGAIIHPLVADILDRRRMELIFGRFRPDVVFHAAAHKHVYLMERQPAEAIRNNSIGTRAVAELSAEFGASAFVLISTDKAINPTSLMGASKRLAEIHLQALQLSHTGGTKFMAVRFGNVLGSSGSVVPIFKKQIAAGGPVTVTHAEVTRFFMTIPEAAGLVLQASVLGKGGEIFVLDMGQPVRIVDLARQMIELSGFKVGDDIEIKFTGLKPGEKLYEELRHRDERFIPTEHPRVLRFVPAVDATAASLKAISTLEPLMYQVGNNDIKLMLKDIVAEYVPYLD